ncbi:P-loop containing nucleoside triphosphate hydrolase protein [Lactifluus subvellereus]|nr:P-loop containing nucleoside triphosphate hydrolase protein [Lactifluus subvellereus]
MALSQGVTLGDMSLMGFSYVPQNVVYVNAVEERLTDSTGAGSVGLWRREIYLLRGFILSLVSLPLGYSMVSTTTTLHQDEIPGAPTSALVRKYSLETVHKMKADVLSATASQGPRCAVGVSIGLARDGPRIRTLALATPNHVFHLVLHKPPSSAQNRILQKLFPTNSYLTGFEFPYTIVLLAHTLGCSLSGHDLSTITLGSKVGDIMTPGTLINAKNPSACAKRIDERWDICRPGSETKSTEPLEPDHCLRAWITAIAASMALEELLINQSLSTKSLDRPMLQCFVASATRSIRLDLLRPLVQEADFAKVELTSNGPLAITNARFKTRIRASKQTRLQLHLDNGDVVRQAPSVLTAAADKVTHIRVTGREERTNAEEARYRFLRSSLNNIRNIPSFAKIIWFPRMNDVLRFLNDSQREVATAMLSISPRDSLVIAHGPPGTGKTTTIAAAAATWVDRKLPSWIIAQSNVGVKNIAEKLFEKKVKFKLIVSKDFLFEWHEELYSGIEDVVIRTDRIPKGVQDVATLFSGITLVLCTLCTLSNPKLDECGLLDLIPMRSLVIDEASQIDVFEFMHLFYKFSEVLMKVCFFGDPKQLPPYGAEEANLETIFDVKHLDKTSYFLGTQYRLPVPLGQFISENVYDGKLHSDHKIVDHSCIAFVDVQKGKEIKQGMSYTNTEEVRMVVRIAKRYHQHRLNFCIITFYDPQRNAISKALASENLPTGSLNLKF